MIVTSISLIGENKTSTIIEPSYDYYTISIRTNNVTIRGFTINCTSIGGSCIISRGVSYTTISDNILLNGKGGIFLGSDLGQNNYNQIVGNKISGCVKAIYASSPRFHTISNNIITDNQEIIQLFNAQHVTISYNIITMNDYSLDIEYLQDGEIYNNTIMHNDGGIFIVGNNNTIRNNYIGENKGPGNHGFGIMIVESENTVIKDNNIINNSWKGIDIKYSSNIEITHNNLKENLKGSFIISGISRGVKISQNNIIEKHPRFVYFMLIPVFNIIVFFGNYWNNAYLHQKFVFGIFGLVIFEGGGQFPYYFPPIFLPIPGFKVDLKPAQEPYNIPGMGRLI